MCINPSKFFKKKIFFKSRLSYFVNGLHKISIKYGTKWICWKSLNWNVKALFLYFSTILKNFFLFQSCIIPKKQITQQDTWHKLNRIYIHNISYKNKSCSEKYYRHKRVTATKYEPFQKLPLKANYFCTGNVFS